MKKEFVKNLYGKCIRYQYFSSYYIFYVDSIETLLKYGYVELD